MALKPIAGIMAVGLLPGLCWGRALLGGKGIGIVEMLVLAPAISAALVFPAFYIVNLWLRIPLNTFTYMGIVAVVSISGLVAPLVGSKKSRGKKAHDQR